MRWPVFIQKLFTAWKLRSISSDEVTGSSAIDTGGFRDSPIAAADHEGAKPQNHEKEWSRHAASVETKNESPNQYLNGMGKSANTPASPARTVEMELGEQTTEDISASLRTNESTPICLSLLKEDDSIVDFGDLVTLSLFTRKVLVTTYTNVEIEALTDIVKVQPTKISIPGTHELILTLDAEQLVSNTLLETGVNVREKQESQFLRVTARVGDLQIEIPKSSLIDIKPWTKVAQLYGHRDRATAITFLDDYRALISADSLGNLCWWDMSVGGDLMAVNPMDSKIWSLATDREGSLVAVGLHDGTIAILDAKKRQERWRAKLHKGPICGLAFSHDCQFLYAGSLDKTYSRISANTGKPFYCTTPQRTVLRSLVLSGNGHVVATTNQGRGDVSLFEAKTGELIAELKGHSNDITCVAFSLDDYLLASGSKDDTVRLWDASTQKELSKLSGFSRGVLGVAISPDGRLLATTSGEPKVRIWRLKTQERLADVESGSESIQSICFSPDQQLLAGASDDGSIYVWRVEDEVE